MATAIKSHAGGALRRRNVVDEAPHENPWIALDASTPPLVRARDLRRAWEHFIEDDRIEAVRSPVAESWLRSRAAGVDPAVEQVAPTLAERDEAAARWESHPLVKAAPLVSDSLAGIADESDQRRRGHCPYLHR
jgi:hypothetical protein